MGVILQNSLILAAGILLLNFGAHGLVRGAASLAKGLGVKPLLIGLTIVAFGTSAPEFIVSIIAAAKNQFGIAFGNVVGSNIANLGLILGISALIAPLKVSPGLYKKGLPFLTVVTLLLLIFSFNGYFTVREGVVFVLLMAMYLGFVIHSGLKGDTSFADYAQEIPTEPPRYLLDITYLIAGSGLLLAGSHFVVNAGVGLMRAFHVSDLVIGLTLIAVGTSLPELATSVVSVFKGETDICVGNVIGSNIFNILFVLGFVALFGDISFEKTLGLVKVQLWILMFMTVLLFPILGTQRQVDKKEGMFLLAVYTAFIAMLFLAPDMFSGN